MATQPTSRFVPRARTPLDWTADPLFRAKKGSITPVQQRAGLGYNKALYAPDSTSARALFRPPTPTGPTFRAASTGWEASTGRVAPGDFASRYGTASLRTFPGQEAARGVARLQSANPFNPENPNLSGIDGPDPVLAPPPGVAGPTGVPGVLNPNLAPLEPASSPYLESDGYVPGMPEGWRPPSDPVAPDDYQPTPSPPATPPAYAPPKEKTPEQMAKEAEALFMAKGGSQRSWNKGMAAAGIKPRIDARAVQSPQNSTTSADIRKKWGWGVDPMSLPY